MSIEIIVSKIKGGDKKLIGELWTKVEKFAYKQANIFFNTYTDRCQSVGLELDDLYQESFFAVHKAIEKYNPDKGTAFLTCFGYYLKAQFFDSAKMHSTGWRNNSVYYAESLDAPAYKSSTETKLDLLSDDENTETTIVDRLYTENLSSIMNLEISKIRVTWQGVIKEIYYNDVKAIDLAKQKGVSRGVICKQHRAALKALGGSPILRAYALI